MQNEEGKNQAPDWANRAEDLLCPLCGYNLRGLSESRCPECGFKFTWQELIEAEKTSHVYLFEYGKGRNIRTFWKTYWRTCQPRRFWRDVNPARDVRWLRLIIYWILSSSLIVLLGAVPYVKPAWQLGNQILSARAAFKPIPSMPNYFTNGAIRRNPGGLRFAAGTVLTAAQLDDYLPPPWSMKFWQEVQRRELSDYYRSYFVSSNPIVNPTIGWGVIFLAWPFITLIALMVFRLSMRQAKIRVAHLVRAVVYSCDFGLLIVTAAVASYFFVDLVPSQGSDMVVFAAICAVVTTYRLTIAFRRYLRVHLPFATVLASEMIALLIAIILLTQIADFSRRI
jgi:hypothetical protein